MFTYITKFVTTMRVKKITRLVDRCIPCLHLGKNLYLLRIKNCFWGCRGEKSENEYNDCLHRLYIKVYICAIDKKNKGYDKKTASWIL